MIRRIIKIDEELCNGCGKCAQACHEGAIKIVDGKAKLIRDDYCDGLGDCLPSCPTGAISFEEREAADYDAVAVEKNKGAIPCCPGNNIKTINRSGTCIDNASNQLRQWPVQIKLVPVNAPYFNGLDLLISADCAAYAFGDFHNRFIKGHITLIGCPKLDNIDYSEKLSEILRLNDIKSITIVRIEVPCCSGLVKYVSTAITKCGKKIPAKVFVISSDGRISSTSDLS